MPPDNVPNPNGEHAHGAQASKLQDRHGWRPATAEELRDLGAAKFRILANLSTDDPHWRRTAFASLALTVAAVAGAARTDGPLRVILAFVAAVLALPALSLTCMIGLALLLQRGERDQAERD